MYVVVVFGTWGDLCPLLEYTKRKFPDEDVLVVTHIDLCRRLGDRTHTKLFAVNSLSYKGDKDAELSDLMKLTKDLTTNIPKSIFCNLFALEGIPIAELLGVECVVIGSFFAMDFPRPLGFDKAFGELNSNLDAETIKHWAWRLCLSDHGEFRERLGLPALPERIPLLVYTISPALLELTEKPIPKTVTVVGSYCRPSSLSTADARSATLSNYPHLACFVESCLSRPIVHIGFGSMDSLYPSLTTEVESVQELVAALNSALEKANCYAIWVVNAPNTSLLGKTLSKVPCPRICVIQGPVEYADFFAAGLVMGSINHGGLGTISQVSMAGLKQVVAPFMFDQRIWGNRLARVGVVKCVSESDVIDVDVDEWSALLQWLCCVNNKSDNSKLVEWRDRVLQMIDDR
ncbi:hypothetical protein BDR26DRAFT_866051 [Obelidium mucronatum]|nr:hypothetical protein BDR26DRAFT_866051 [Obelidium mucronatum]